MILERPLHCVLGDLIAARELAGLDADSAYLRTLGFKDATLREHLPAAREHANRVKLAADLPLLRQGVG